ncbi:uncharacterized protein KY384_007736 [Bacidia gigantensis]|uniref:uncharacterized protein n=1 Tax=Bacidia gigantensis TaxID=2732470 RepID=UPI001D042ADE|nr:uncharacterized protein KY384_007736 [Bacidia gigantensis]KAG8527583.1 hypothetical protein KY384_007736 [Bacidia gigantensis]
MAKHSLSQGSDEQLDFESQDSESNSEESSSDEDTDLLNVEFEWFDPQPEHDFQGIKTLLRQLFDVDSQLFDLSGLADLILGQPLLGSTVKTEGNESDPYALLTVLNLHEHRVRTVDSSMDTLLMFKQKLPVISNLINYLKDRCLLDDRALKIRELLQAPENAHVGLILTERLINVPAQVVPPMYKMLLEEITWALEEKEPYHFTHFLILSKTYREMTSVLEDDTDGKHKNKKLKRVDSAHSSEVFFFHPEDEAFQRHAATYSGFDYKSEGSQSDSKRAFHDLGIKPQGHMILIEAEKFETALQAVQDFVG